MSSGAIFLMGVFTITVLIDMPIAFGLVLSCLAYLAIYDSAPMMVAAQQYVVGLDSFTLLAIPLFILAAQLMNGAGLTQRIVRLCAAIVGDIKGGLAGVAVLACLMFGALSGSGVADVVAMHVQDDLVADREHLYLDGPKMDLLARLHNPGCGRP
ncbi:hypothetical protein G6F50_016568 [Rhizopus delemar]|uniref:TRAP C4-dicarboxylate transport system permease DctM subunit domain-containing protein n=1 Tax=Rhizopus delemar TaxID=936053 RepID=A0A9P6XT73_9FUNG|nr:hypothetical protein G6F50_016568 [Rhizopus delemar]